MRIKSCDFAQPGLDGPIWAEPVSGPTQTVQPCATGIVGLGQHEMGLRPQHQGRSKLRRVLGFDGNGLRLVQTGQRAVWVSDRDIKGGELNEHMAVLWTIAGDICVNLCRAQKMHPGLV